MRKKLTDLFVERVAPPAKGRVEYFDTTFPALALRITETGSKSWSLFYRAGGRQRRYTIGSYPAFKPADARKAASAALHRVEAGGDPAEEKRARRHASSVSDGSFATVARNYLDRQVKPNSAAKTYREHKRIFERDVIPIWGRRPIASIARRDVAALIDAKAASGAGIQANRTLARLRTLFGWALSKDLVTANPCDALRPPTKEKARDRVLADAEIVTFWAACGAIGWPFGPLFQLLLLTAQRREEAASVEWREIDIQRRIWAIPREKAKNDKAHDVALSEQALKVIGALPRTGDFVFSVNGRTPVSGFSRAKERLDDAMAAIAKVEPFTTHDLRRTATTGMAKLKFPPHVVDRILNHTSGAIKGVAATYNRFDYGDERRDALAAWGRAVESMVSGAPAANVIELAQVRS
jgi:integrase